MRRPASRVLIPIIVVLCTACGGVVSTVFTDVGQAAPELPPACEEAIGDFLVEIEPIVSSVDFETASEEEITSVGQALAPAGERFDPDLCPDLDVEQSRAAWLAVADARAPGTRGYVEYTYPEE